MTLVAERASEANGVPLQCRSILVEDNHHFAVGRHSSTHKMIASNLVGNIVPIDVVVVGPKVEHPGILPGSVTNARILFHHYKRVLLPLLQLKLCRDRCRYGPNQHCARQKLSHLSSPFRSLGNLPRPDGLAQEEAV